MLWRCCCRARCRQSAFAKLRCPLHASSRHSSRCCCALQMQRHAAGASAYLGLLLSCLRHHRLELRAGHRLLRWRSRLGLSCLHSTQNGGGVALLELLSSAASRVSESATCFSVLFINQCTYGTQTHHGLLLAGVCHRRLGLRVGRSCWGSRLALLRWRGRLGLGYLQSIKIRWSCSLLQRDSCVGARHLSRTSPAKCIQSNTSKHRAGASRTLGFCLDASATTALGCGLADCSAGAAGLASSAGAAGLLSAACGTFRVHISHIAQLTCELQCAAGRDWP